MHATSSAPRQQQNRVQQHILKSDIYSFFNVLTSEELLWHVEQCLPEHRERQFPPTETLAMFLSQALNADRSCQHIVNQAAMNRLLGGLRPCSTSTGGYCRARQRLPLEMVRDLARLTGQLIDEQVPLQWRWRGRPVRLIDGSTVTLPDTAANQAAYPQQQSQKDGLGFPICRFVGITCLSSGAVLDVAEGRYQGKGSDEQSLLRSLLHNLETDDIVLGDAFYCTYFLLAELQAKGIDGVFEQHGTRRRKTDFRTGQKLGLHDHLVTYTKPKIQPRWMSDDAYAAAPDHITVRELKVGGKVLVTTLCCPNEVPKQAVKDLYSSRWHVELDLRHIKTTLGMETLSCKTPDMVIKELWIYMLAYNLIRLLMAQSALLADRLPRTLSFKHTVQLWLSFKNQQGRTYDEQDIGVLMELIAERVVGNRPGRIEPRAVKRRPKPLPLLMKPRQIARAQVERYGHP
jgi:hypothetical protein